MNGTFKIGSLTSIPIRVHWSFLLVLPFLASLFARHFLEAVRVAGIPPERVQGSPWVWGLLVAVGLFVSVLVHELAIRSMPAEKGDESQTSRSS